MWIKWLEDSRVGFTDRQARNYMTITRELGEIGNGVSVLNDLSLRKLYSLASAPEEVNIRWQIEIISIWQLKKT